MRKKRNKVIIPEGAELTDYLNRGFAIATGAERLWTGKKTREVAAIFTPAHRADGRLTKWSMSTRAEIRWSSYQDERGDDYLVFRDDMPPAGCRGLRRTLPSLQGVVQDVRRLSIINAEEKPRNRGFSSLYLQQAQE